MGDKCKKAGMKTQIWGNIKKTYKKRQASFVLKFAYVNVLHLTWRIKNLKSLIQGAVRVSVFTCQYATARRYISRLIKDTF